MQKVDNSIIRSMADIAREERIRSSLNRINRIFEMVDYDTKLGTDKIRLNHLEEQLLKFEHTVVDTICYIYEED